MQNNTKALLILGITEKGKTFRPSDWAERLCGACARYSNNGRWTYSEHVYPVIYEDSVSVRVNMTLQDTDPAGYKFIMDFACCNQLKLMPLAAEHASLNEAADATEIVLSVRKLTFALLLHQWKTSFARKHFRT